MTVRRASVTARLGTQARAVDGLSISHGFVLDGGDIHGLDGRVTWADSAPVTVPALPSDGAWDRGPGLPLMVDWADDQGIVRVATARLDGSSGDGLGGVASDLTDWTSRLTTTCEIRPTGHVMPRNAGLPGSTRRMVALHGTWITAEAMRQAGFHTTQAMQRSSVAFHSMAGSAQASPDPDTTHTTMGEVRQAYQLRDYGEPDVNDVPWTVQGDDTAIMRGVYLLGVTRRRRRSSVAHWQMTQDLGVRNPASTDVGRCTVRPVRASDGAGMRLEWDASRVRLQRVNPSGNVVTLTSWPRGESMRWSVVIRANGTATVYNDLQGATPVAQVASTGVTALPTNSDEASYLVESPGRISAFQLSRSDSPFLVTQAVGAKIARSKYADRALRAIDWISPRAAGNVLALQAKAEVGWRGIGLCQWIDEDGRLQNHDFYSLASGPILHVLTTRSSGDDALDSAAWSVPGSGPWQSVSVQARVPSVSLRDRPTLLLGEGSRETVPRGEKLEQYIHPSQDQTWLQIDTSMYLVGHPYGPPTNKEFDNQHGTWGIGHRVDADGKPAGWATINDITEWSFNAAGEVRNALTVLDPRTILISGTVNTPPGLSLSTMPSPASAGLPEHRKSQPLAQIRGTGLVHWSVETVDAPLSGDDRHEVFTHDAGMFGSHPAHQAYMAAELADSVSNPAVIFTARCPINPRVRVGQRIQLHEVYPSGWTRAVTGVVTNRRIDFGGRDDVMTLQMVRTSDHITAPDAPLPAPDPTPPPEAPPIPPQPQPDPQPPLDPTDPPDTPAPGKPSTPAVSVDVNLLHVAWDGLLATGDSAIDDDYGTLEVAVAVGSGPGEADVVGRAELADDGWRRLVHGPVPLESTWHVRARILNKWGTPGPWSDEVLTEVPPLVDPEQFEEVRGRIDDAAEWIGESGATLDTLLGGDNVIPQAVIDHLWTNVVRSRQITTDMLMVGAGDNLVPDPNFTNERLTDARHAASDSGWLQGVNEFVLDSGQTGRTFRAVAAPPPMAPNNGGPGGKDPAPPSPGGRDSMAPATTSTPERFFPITPGHTYRVRYQRSQTATFGANASSRPVVRWINAAGSSASTVYPRSTYHPATRTWQWDEVEWTAPETAAGAYISVQGTTGPNDTLRVRNISMTSKTDGSLIVDGVIEGRHVNAQSIAAEVGEFLEISVNQLTAGDIDVLMNLTAGGRIQSGSLNGGGVAYMEGGDSGSIGFQVPAEDGVTPITVAQMGRDWIGRNSAGDPTYSMTGEDGAVAGITGDFSELYVAGQDVAQALEDQPKLTVNDDTGFVSRGPYSDQHVGYREVGFTSKPGHIYEIDVRVHLVNESSQARTHITYLRHQHGSLGNTSVVATVNSPEISSDDGQISAGQEGRFRMTGYWRYHTPREVRLLVTARHTGAGGAFRFARSVIVVKDLGLYEPQVTSGRFSLGGGASTPPPPNSPPQIHRAYFDFDWFQVFQQHGRSDPTVGGLGSRMRQGRIGAGVSSNFPYGTLLRIPDAARQALIGASRVKAWVQLTNIGYVDGQVVAGQSTATSNPTQFPTPIGPTTVGSLPRGATRLLRLPDAWEPRWQAGTNRSLTLGRVDSSGNNDRLLDFRNLSGGAATKARLYFEWEA